MLGPNNLPGILFSPSAAHERARQVRADIAIAQESRVGPDGRELPLLAARVFAL